MSHINKITISNRQNSDIAHRNIFIRLYIIKYIYIILFSKQNVSGEHPRIHMRRPCFAMQEEDNGRVAPKDDTVGEEYKYNNIILAPAPNQRRHSHSRHDVAVTCLGGVLMGNGTKKYDPTMVDDQVSTRRFLFSITLLNLTNGKTIMYYYLLLLYAFPSLCETEEIVIIIITIIS